MHLVCFVCSCSCRRHILVWSLGSLHFARHDRVTWKWRNAEVDERERNRNLRDKCVSPSIEHTIFQRIYFIVYFHFDPFQWQLTVRGLCGCRFEPNDERKWNFKAEIIFESIAFVTIARRSYFTIQTEWIVIMCFSSSARCANIYGISFYCKFELTSSENVLKFLSSE